MTRVSYGWKVALALLTVYIVWGTTHFATLTAVQTLPPILMTGARFVTAGLLMLAVAPWEDLSRCTFRQIANCVLAGVLMSFASMTLAVLAIANGVATGLMACIVATMPMWLTLFAKIGGERVPMRGWMGVLLGVLGASLLLLDGNLTSTPLGTSLALLSPVCWAAGSYCVRRLSMPPMATASGLQWLSGGMAGLLAGLVLEADKVSGLWGAASLASLAAWTYLLLFGTLLTYTAYLWLVRNVSAPLAGSGSFVNPVIAVAIGGYLAGEQLDVLSFVAVPIILCALVLIVGLPRTVTRSGA